MNVYITGVSRGLGLSLATEYLRKGENVIGIGRNNFLNEKNYSFKSCDLSLNEDVLNLQIELPEKEEIILINNAGVLGDVKRVSDQENDFSNQLFQVNTISPIQLTRKFARWAEEKDCKLTVVNISSGAGRRAIPSWANYCASKAALDLFSETFQLEEIEKGRKTKIYALAPGVIDTEMQGQIRKVNSIDFSSIENFKDLKNSNQLQTPEETAKSIIEKLESNFFETVICRI
jgi:benzil reductase ((S)-benzoin forming)